MTQYQATFEIDSRADAEAVRVLVERAYDTLREETRRSYGEEGVPSEMLDAVEAIRDATRQSTPGRLTIELVQSDEMFED